MNPLLAVFSGLLFAASWPDIGGITPIVFISFIPLFLLENNISSDNRKGKIWRIWGLSYLAFLTWNLCTTWWIYYASAGGMLMANLANSLLMTFPFMAYHVAKKKIGMQRALVFFVIFWMAFEYLHSDWDLSWIWLNLGNVFAKNIAIIQWYEFTGSLGGSLWVLTLNMLLFYSLMQWQKSRKFKIQQISFVLLILILPISASYLIGQKQFESIGTVSVVVLQPNIDPYVKFRDFPPKEQMARIIELAKSKVNSKTDYLIAPETAIARSFWEDRFPEMPEYRELYNLIDSFPNLNIIIGASTLLAYRNDDEITETARKTKDNLHYDYFNTGLQLNAQSIDYYHKSKLVPGVERMPFPSVFKHIESFAIDLGGTTGSLGMQENRAVFTHHIKSSKAAPVICYESIYGDFVGDFIRKGAHFISIITNDGWWDDTPGYRQHLHYASLRAIEHRRYIARSANTGTSAFIDMYGNITQNTDWWVPAAIESEIPLHENLTFYSRFGDYLGRISMFLAPLLLLSVIVKRKK